MTEMTIKSMLENSTARIMMSGRFDFNSHRQFRETYDEILKNPETGEIEVDLGAVEYLDSSALGMLLLLHEKANSCNKSLALTNCHGIVRQVLEVANFGRLLTIR